MGLAKRPLLQPELAAACTHAVSPLLIDLAESGRNASLCITRKLSYKVIQLYPNLMDALFSVLSHNVWGIVLSLFGLWCLGAWMVWACFSLHRQTHQLISQVIAATGKDGRSRFTYKDLEGLPEPVQRYFKYALEDRQPCMRYVVLNHTGWCRPRTNLGLRPDEGWKKVRAQQYISAVEPAYIWSGYCWLAPLFWLRGWDRYIRGEGHIMWKILFLFSMVDQKGPEASQAALVRYLSEACYFPTALLPSKYLAWQAIDGNTAKATIVYGDCKASGIFHFNAKGQITKLYVPQRCRLLEDGTPSASAWSAHYSNYQRRSGIYIPMRMETVWHFVSGPFSYAELDIASYSWFSRLNRTSLSDMGRPRAYAPAA